MRDAAARSVLERAFRILGAYSPADRELTLAEITRRTEIPKPTVHRLAGELLTLGQVVAAISVTGPVHRLDPGRYAPTVRLAALALSRRLGRLPAAPGTGSGRGTLAR